jgi:hypothetical protein
MFEALRVAASGFLAGAFLLGCEAVEGDRPTYGLIFGTVTTAGGAGVPGVSLTAYGTPTAVGCDLDAPMLNEVTTTPVGAYRLGIGEIAPADSECVFIRVLAPPGLRDTTVGPVRIRMRRPLQDSTALDIILAP